MDFVILGCLISFVVGVFVGRKTVKLTMEKLPVVPVDRKDTN